MNHADQKLAETKRLLALCDKHLDEGNIEKAKEYLYLASNSNQEAFSAASKEIEKLNQKIDRALNNP